LGCNLIKFAHIGFEQHLAKRDSGPPAGV